MNQLTDRGAQSLFLAPRDAAVLGLEHRTYKQLEGCAVPEIHLLLAKWGEDTTTVDSEEA